MSELRAYYVWDGDLSLDNTIATIIGRQADFSGTWVQTGERELGWVGLSDFAIERAKRGLHHRNIRFAVLPDEPVSEKKL